MMELPEGWSETTVGSLSQDISYGFTTSASSTPKGPRFLRITDIQNGTVDWNSVPFCKAPPGEASRFLLKVGDIVFARTGATTGKSFLIRFAPEAVFASYLIRLRPSECFLPELMAYFFQSAAYWKQIMENLSGSAQPNCNATKLSSLTVLVPPLNEQRRIVAKIEKLMSREDAAQARLANIPRILKRFRQSVLAAACSGRLTADWRESNPKTRPVVFSFEATDLTGNGELPSTWAALPVGDIISDLKYGTSQKCSYEKLGVPVLRIPNIGDGLIDTGDLKYGKLPQRELEQLKLSPGDILLIRSNGSVSLVGKSALVRKRESGFAYAGYLIRLRANRSYVEPKFLNLALSSHDVRLQIELPARSTSGVHNINSDEVRALRIGVAPIAEQQEIVRRVEALFKTAEALEARYRTAKAHVDKLKQSILAKAFRGELVPQDPNDEPASVLLERIRQSKDGVSVKKRSAQR